MKKTFIFFLITGLLFTINSNAQSKEERAVSAAVETFRKAMVEADSVTLMTIVRKEVSYGHSSGRVEDKAAFIASLTSGRSDFVSIDLSDQTVQVVDKTAIVRHTLTANTNDSGKPGNVKLSVLTVWEKEGRKWTLLARQAVRL